jgi:hypothetical protein
MDDDQSSECAAILPSSGGWSGSLGPLPPLLKLATRDLYLRNPFCRLGLPVTATAREVGRRVEALKLELEFGGDAVQPKSGFGFVGPLDPDVLRDCAQVLRDPVARFVYEFFWFWPSSWSSGTRDAALIDLGQGRIVEAVGWWEAAEGRGDVSASHCLAIYHHFRALEGAAGRRGGESLREANRRWRGLCDREEYWDFLRERLDGVQDPQLTAGFLARFRETIPLAVAKIALEQVLAIHESGDVELSLALLEASKTGPGGLEEWRHAMELVLAPIRERLDHAVAHARERLESDKRAGVEISQVLVRSAEPELARLELFYGVGSNELHHSADAVVTVCINAAVAYQRETDDNQGFLAALEAANEVDVSGAVVERHAENIRIARANIAYQSLVEPLEKELNRIIEFGGVPRQKLAALRAGPIVMLEKIKREATRDTYEKACISLTVALRATAIKAFNDHKDFDTAEAATRLALSLVSGNKELETQLQEDLGVIERNRPSVGKTLRAILGYGLRHPIQSLFCCFLLYAGVSAVMEPSSGNRPRSAPTQSSPSYVGSPVSTPGPTVPSSVSGGTYSIPRNMTGSFNAKKSQITSLETQIDSTKRMIESRRILLNNYDQSAVDDFNRMVERYNALVESHDRLVEEYNSDLARYGRRR